ncbi:hypothetical protein DL96DRAFT_1168466 [Flagelloscypha sp. PMI_526]|nr:hypothetical protein DL96DRAFT_1168466 [Flagelloscypha sp. PMI_526]
MPGCRVMYSSARCEPNPSSIYPATKDVFNSAEVVMTHWKDAVATIYIHLLPFPHLDMPISFALYVHRTSLLHLFDSWFPSSIWLPEPDAEEERFLAEVDDSSNLDDDEELDLPGTFRENAKIPSSTLLNGDAAASVRARPIMLIPWELWGPRYARMLNCTSDLADINTDWITTSCGHRVVRYSPNGFREATQQPPRVREPIYGDVEEEDAESIQPTEPSEIDPDENVQMSADTAEDAMWPTESDSSQETDEPDTQAPVLDGVHELIHRFQLLQQSLETQVIASQQTDGAQSAGAGSSSSIPNATTLSAYQQTLNTRIQALQDLIHRLEGAAAAREQSGSGNDTLESEEDSENRPVGHTIEVLTFPPPCLGTVDVDEPRRIMMHSPDAEMYDPQHCWAQRVISNLPYQTVKVNWEGVLVIEKEVDGKGKGKAINHDETEDSDYDGVLMDEENLILVRSRSNHDDNDATRLAVRILKFDGREIS